MVNLIQDIVNEYKRFLNNLLYGKVSQKYELLYNSIIGVKEGITEKKYEEYFTSNLNPPKLVSIVRSPITAITVGGESLADDVQWTEIHTPSMKQYIIQSFRKIGDNYIYFSIDKELDFILFDVNDINITDLFTLNTDQLTSEGYTNDVYRSNAAIDTSQVIFYKIILM